MQIEEKNVEMMQLTRVPTILAFEEGAPENLKTVAIIDTETTGIDTESCEIIELGYMLVNFDSKGRFYDVKRFNQLNEPSEPISEEITKVTGITNEELKGQSIDWNVVLSDMEKADLIVAHNAGFDRPVVERYLDIFTQKRWGCSMAMINYLDLFDVGSRSQEFLLFKVAQSYYSAHRAIDDVNALSFLLHQKAPDERPLFRHLLDTVNQKHFIVAAKNAPFDDKDALKSAGCRWNSSSRVWAIKTTEGNLESAKAKIQAASPSCSPIVTQINSKDLFSIREP